jgi:hypothetical protein
MSRKSTQNHQIFKKLGFMPMYGFFLFWYKWNAAEDCKNIGKAFDAASKFANPRVPGNNL